MPLVSGKKAKTSEGFSENVRREMNAGKKQSQAVAIAYSQKGEGKKKSASAEKIRKKLKKSNNSLTMVP